MIVHLKTRSLAISASLALMATASAQITIADFVDDYPTV